MKIVTRRKAVPTTEYPAIGQISVKAPAFLFQILFIVWVVWIVMKWIVLEDVSNLLSWSLLTGTTNESSLYRKLLDQKGKLGNKQYQCF
jgi:hypothetical protein